MQHNEVHIRQVEFKVTVLYLTGDVLKVYRNTKLEQRGEVMTEQDIGVTCIQVTVENTPKGNVDAKFNEEKMFVY